MSRNLTASAAQLASRASGGKGLEVLASAIAALEQVLLPELIDEGLHYGYRPHRADHFVRELEALPLAAGRRFLEVGCGPGTKLLLARELGLQPVGLEIRPEYVELARRVTGGEISIHCGDARSWDGYADFDLVYANRACRDDAAQLQLERQILRQLRPGTLLWALDWVEAPSLEVVAPLVWRA